MEKIQSLEKINALKITCSKSNTRLKEDKHTFNGVLRLHISVRQTDKRDLDRKDILSPKSYFKTNVNIHLVSKEKKETFILYFF